MAKTAQLQIRVTAAQKARLRQLAAAADQDLSAYVLARALPADAERFAAILRSLAREEDHRFALAALHDFLVETPPGRFSEAVGGGVGGSLPPLLRNYVAAMVEQAAAQKGVPAPAWTAAVEPLDEPYFASPLRSLRLHLLAASPVPFRRRNLFVDAVVGDRV